MPTYFAGWPGFVFMDLDAHLRAYGAFAIGTLKFCRFFPSFAMIPMVTISHHFLAVGAFRQRWSGSIDVVHCDISDYVHTGT